MKQFIFACHHTDTNTDIDSRQLSYTYYNEMV